MQDHSTDAHGLVARFGETLAAAVAGGTFVKLLPPVGEAPDAPKRVLGRCVDVKGRPHLSLTFRYAKRDEVRNIPGSECAVWAIRQLALASWNALLCTSDGDWQLSMPSGKRPRLIRHRPASRVVPTREHDERHRSILDASARNWLTGLGVSDSTGKVRPALVAKVPADQPIPGDFFAFGSGRGLDWIISRSK